MLTIYDLKPKFQAILRPISNHLHLVGVKANHVTIFACIISIAIGLILYFTPLPRAWFLLIPVWMFLRMALNAIDGILAREFGDKSSLGAYLNEITDVLADSFLFLPFVHFFGIFPIFLIIILSIISEYSGVMGEYMSGERRYDGPMGKSDRAFIFGLIAILINFNLGKYLQFLLPVISILLCVTIYNRIHNSLKKIK